RPARPVAGRPLARAERCGVELSSFSPTLDGGQPVALEAQNAQHAVVRAVDPFLNQVFAPIVGAQGVADRVAMRGSTTLALDFERSVAEADQIIAAAQSVGTCTVCE